MLKIHTSKTIKYVVLNTFFLCIFVSPAQNIVIPNPQNYPTPTALSLTDNSKLGALIPRSMHLLHSGQKIKIAIYGQSLSSPDNAWWTTLGNALKTAYPNAEIDIRSYGVGGVSSILLWRLTNQELVAFHPDLVIFHVYGNHYFYETIIRQIKGCTTAEILVQGDHFSKTDGTVTGGKWNYDLTDMTKWDNNMSFQIVKGYCDNYKLERNNRRQEWYDYLRANSYTPDKLLKDNIHFNEQGQWLVAELAARHFVYDANREIDPQGMVTYYEIGKDIPIVNSKISFSFVGDKIELIPSAKTSAVVAATIDGKKPSDFANTYYFTIPAGGFWVGAPFLRPGMGTQQEEDWTITMTGNGNFSVSGSKTGFDGSGNIYNEFISNSKRIVLNKKNDWGNYGAPKTSGTYTFKCKTMSVDKIDFDTISFIAQKENAINLVQGLDNMNHTLELTSSNGIFPIKYIKVYKPTFKLFVNAPTVITAPTNGGTVSIPVSGNTFWQASHKSTRLGALSNWNNIQLQNGDDFSIMDGTVNISCSIPALTGVNAAEYIYIYGQGCDVKVVEIRQGVFSDVYNPNDDKVSKIYPIPVKDKLTITNSTEGEEVAIYQLNGRLLNNFKIIDSAIYLSDLAAGNYVLKTKKRSFVFAKE